MAPPILEANSRTIQRCIMSTAVGVNVLQAFGITDARPLSLTLDVVNAAYLDWVREGKPGGIFEYQRRNCHVLSAGYPPGTPGIQPIPDDARPGWHGHVVVWVPSVQTIIDLNMGGMSRPQKGMAMPDSAVLKLPTLEGFDYDLPNGGKMRIVGKADDWSFTDAKDWQMIAGQLNEPTTREVWRAVRAGKF